MIKILQTVINKIESTIGKEPIESGGIIGGNNNTITHFYFDNANNRSDYVPNVGLLNEVIVLWSKEDVELYGVVHSHPIYSPKPSKEDLEYALKLKENNPFLEIIIFPIVIKNNRNETEINFYQLIGDMFTKIDVEIV